MVYDNFKLNERYSRVDGVVVTIVTRWEYRIAKNGNTGAIVTGDDGMERWDDPEPGFGRCYAVSDSTKDLVMGAIPAGRKHSGPKKIR